MSYIKIISLTIEKPFRFIFLIYQHRVLGAYHILYGKHIDLWIPISVWLRYGSKDRWDVMANRHEQLYFILNFVQSMLFLDFNQRSFWRIFSKMLKLSFGK